MPSSDERAAPGPWSAEVLRSRIADERARLRYEAGSPNPDEIAAYARGLTDVARDGTAVVLGMTPELRSLALGRCERLVTVERSAESIALYRDWVPAASADRERIVQADWLALDRALEAPAAAVLGDGIFGNLPSVDAHLALLQRVRDALVPGAPFVVRKALLPRGFDPEKERFEALLERHRRGDLDEAEFGFAARLLGHHRESHDPQSFELDNARTFAFCERAFAAGALDAREWQAIRRYYFTGTNCIVSQDVWEALLEEAGFGFALHRCTGRDWYRYYPVYECRPRA